jgi:Glycosyl hydrolase family 26
MTGPEPAAATASPPHSRAGRRRWSWRPAGQRLTALVVVVAVGVGAYVLWPSPPLNSKTVCAYVGDTTSALATFSKQVGQQVNCAVLFSYSNKGWAQWVSPWFTHRTSGGTDWSPWITADPSQRRIVITQEMVPAGVPANWRVLGAKGAYDGYARRLAANLVAAGMGNAVIRLGHEMNATTYPDSLGNDPGEYRDWADYWARIVRAMRSVPGAHFLFDWNVNAGYRDIPLNSYYPGNDVVDIIGADVYDVGMPGDPKDQASRWASLSGEPGGLDQIVAFAKAHNKPLSIPEWGLVGASDGGIGDDPAYVQGIVNQISDSPVVYQAYFDHPTGGVLPVQDAPKSLLIWRQFFGPGGSLSGRPW